MVARRRIAFLTVQLEFDGTYPDLLVKAAQASAESHGCDLLVVPGREWGAGYDREGVLTAVYRLVPQWPLDAIIVSPPVTNFWPEPELARAVGLLGPLPVVTMLSQVGSLPRVELAARQGVADAVRHLIEVHGRQRIACLRGPLHHTAAEDRYRAWHDVLAEAGLARDDSLVAEVEFKEEGVAEALAGLLDRAGPIDGLSAASDLVALGAIRELRRRGLRVPEDVSVVGYDDLPLSAYGDPPLTTVNQDLELQVERAFELALGAIEGRSPKANPVVETRLVVRGSCGCSAPPSRLEAPRATVDLQRRLERLATFNLGLGHRQDETEFPRWLRTQLRHQGFEDSILAVGHYQPSVDPRVGLPDPPHEWTYPLDGRGVMALWGSERRTRVALPLAADRQWFGLLFLNLDVDGALVFRGIQEGLTRHFRELWERKVLVARSVEEQTGRRVEVEKMRSLGTLVAGVAHEVNTPLGNAITAASFLDEHLKAGQHGEPLDLGLLREASALVLKNLDRAADLVARFKRVSVERTLDLIEPLDVGLFIDDLLPSLTFPLRRAGVEFSAEVAPGLRLETSPAALFDILTNLTQNVIDHGFPSGGPGAVRLEAFATPNGGLVLVYSDTGRGMDDETRRKIFDPFFTTRRGQGGTGLGLHLVYNLVSQRLGGRITCESAPGKGAVFRIELPPSIDSPGVPR